MIIPELKHFTLKNQSKSLDPGQKKAIQRMALEYYSSLH